ncbi:hypothetical protein EST38_g7 [Candolleomyces aberdarensis]|uniref:Uncharacterized protein n=1 Tax=Candolleomyces aberdarensis TaxID=2316362 RepID=A0A4Q2E2U2_9AGAR|nr:hypothetical protein EST38_g7 [Candolleomyces aberdarensis]
MRVNFTTYDMRRDQDVLHTNSNQCNIMMLNSAYTAETQTDEHPYLYAQVLGIFHANVSYLGTRPDGSRSYAQQRVDFLWIRWYHLLDHGDPFSLDRLSLSQLSEYRTLDFADPADVLRGVHLIPRFSIGNLKPEGPSSSLIMAPQKVWKEFVDRDMFMRYQWGISVGHTYMHQNFPAPTIPTIPPDFDFFLLPHDSNNDRSVKDVPSSSAISGTSKLSNAPILDPSQSRTQQQGITTQLAMPGRHASTSIDPPSSLGQTAAAHSVLAPRSQETVYQPPVISMPPGHYGNSNTPYCLHSSTKATPTSNPTHSQLGLITSQQFIPTSEASSAQFTHAQDGVEVDDPVGEDFDDLPNERDGADELDELDDAEFLVYDEMYGV